MPNIYDDNSCDDGLIDSLSDYDDEMPEEEYEEPNNAGYKSSSRMRSLLSKAASNVTNSQTNLACLSKLKQNLGSRISLGHQKSMENLNNGLQRKSL